MRAQILSATLLACLLPLVVGQDNPSALTMASTIVNSDSLQLITEGDGRPSFTGPKGTSKLIKDWADGAKVEKVALPDGAVKLMTPPDDSIVSLTFSTVVKVRAGGGACVQAVPALPCYTVSLLTHQHASHDLYLPFAHLHWMLACLSQLILFHRHACQSLSHL
jgi:hypothetical protein